jgi:hypothetical protein
VPEEEVGQQVVGALIKIALQEEELNKLDVETEVEPPSLLKEIAPRMHATVSSMALGNTIPKNVLLL